MVVLLLPQVMNVVLLPWMIDVVLLLPRVMVVLLLLVMFPALQQGGGDQALEEAMEDGEVVEGEVSEVEGDVSVAEGMGFQEEEVPGQEQLL